MEIKFNILNDPLFVHVKMREAVTFDGCSTIMTESDVEGSWLYRPVTSKDMYLLMAYDQIDMLAEVWYKINRTISTAGQHKYMPVTSRCCG